jgi:hypothetical protein
MKILFNPERDTAPMTIKAARIDRATTGKSAAGSPQTRRALFLATPHRATAP